MKINSILRKSIAVVVALAASATAFAADPIMTFRTQVYDNAGPENIFHFVLGATETTTVQVDCGFGPESYEVSPAVFDPTTQVIKGTTIICTVSEEGRVRLYGDASKIDYLDLEGCYVDELDFDDLTNLEILNLDHNKLTKLNLTPFTKLQAIYVNDNPMSESPLVIGADKPELTILEMSMVDRIDSAFTLTDYPTLQVFAAYNCPDLYQVDPSQCPELLSLSVDLTPITTIDVSHNSKLLILNVGETFVKNVDVSANTKLQQLFVNHTGAYGASARLTSLDVTNNPDLVYLFCAGNELTDLDISHNTKLITLSAAYNYMPGIDFSNNPDLAEVDIHDNMMDYVTLPEPRPTFIGYVYSQRPFAVDRSYAVGTTIDFSARVNRPGTTTTGVLCFTNQYGLSEELDDSYYTWNQDGSITVNKTYADSVHVEFTNTMFPEYNLRSANFMVKSVEDFGKPSPLVSFGTHSSVEEVKFSVGILNATVDEPVTFSVDFGDGNLVDFQATSTEMPLAPNAQGTRAGRITVYIPEGRDITAFGIEGIRLNSIDITKAGSLLYFTASDAYMASVDMRYNSLLRAIDLSDNRFVTIDFDGVNENFPKNFLTKLNLAGNRLTSFNLDGKYTEVDLSRNKLTSVVGLGGSQQVLKLADNMLTELELNDCPALEVLDVSGNQLSQIDLSGAPELKTLDISNNNFIFSTMPEGDAYENYKYAPQASFAIPARAPMVDLSALFYPAADSQTQFTWISATTGQPVAADAVEMRNDVFYFIDSTLGTVYCSVSNPAYPQFTGDDALMTTEIEVAPMPDQVCASFVTAADQDAEIILAGVEPGTVTYIDWTGQGDVVQYILNDTYKIFPVTTKAGAEVKVLAYDDNNGISVFSLDGIRLNSIDASGLKQTIMFGLYGSGIKNADLKLPQSDALMELAINNANLTEIDLSAYPDLYYLNLSHNNLTTFDASNLRSLGNLFITYNQLESITLNNPNLWNLALTGNNLSEIDLSKVPSMSQLSLGLNSLTHIDVSGLTDLRELQLDRNYFTFATLPPVSSQYYLYVYANQNPMDVEQVDGVVDLSEQAVINGADTMFLWFSGVPEFDEDGNLVGDVLEDGGDYFIEDGVTSFYDDFSDIMCVMFNQQFPNLVQYTNLMDVVATGLDNVATQNDIRAYVSGSTIIVKASADVDVAIYATNGIQLVRTATIGGTARIEDLAAGVYVLRAGTRTFKLAVH